MRENLFKAKRIEDDEWIEGYYQKRHNFLGNEEHLIFHVDGRTVWEYTEIVPETLCQFTGLCDKNGNKIWENDICDRKEKYPEIVKMNNGDWTLDYSYAFGKEYGYSFCNLGFYATERKYIEVIGNIIDNPELLQEEHK